MKGYSPMIRPLPFPPFRRAVPSALSRTLPLALLCAALLSFSGCAMLGNRQGAEIREPGSGTFGISFGFNSYAVRDTVTDRPQDDSAWALPVLAPELGFATVLSPKWEVGGRASPQALGVEGYVKWGFYQGERFFWALAPAVGGRAAPYGEGFSTFPLLLTYKVNDRFRLHSSVFTTYAAVAESNNKDYEGWVRKTFGDSHGAGLSFGVEFTGRTFFIQPVLEFTGYEPNEPGEVAWKPYLRTSGLLHLGWILK